MAVTSQRAKEPSQVPDTREYRRQFRRHVFCLLALGYDRFPDPASHERSEEPDITGELVRLIRDVTYDRSSPRWAWRFTVHDDFPINAPGRLGKRRGRIDIVLESVCPGNHPHYAFEAKRLSAGKCGMGEYLGEEGLGAFIAGEYVPDSTEAGMVAYVQSHTIARWAAEAKRGFKNDGPAMQVSPGGQWSSPKEFAGLNRCFRSKHRRPTIGRGITIYHLFLVFCREVSSNGPR
jgi:hypothetical protein